MITAIPILIANLEEETAKGFITKGHDDTFGLTIYNYSDKATYERTWTDAIQLARGLVVDKSSQKVLAWPFKKFFNWSEPESKWELYKNRNDFVAYTKVDGSLGICFWNGVKWQICTRGSFVSEQAQWAQKFLDERIQTLPLVKGNTYLFEIIYPENRIVVDYNDFAGLILLDIHDENGKSIFDIYELDWINNYSDIRVVDSRKFNAPSEVIDFVKTLTHNEEGFVLKWSDGHRIKFKSDEYIRIHKLISNVTPLKVWENMISGLSLDFMCKNIPDEFHDDIIQYYELITNNVDKYFSLVQNFIEHHNHISERKEFALAVQKCPRLPKFLQGTTILLYFKKIDEARARKIILESDYIRPNNNIIPSV